MTRARREKRNHKSSSPEQRARVFKSGIYDGTHSSNDFVVAGHSTGSPNSEMEALSIQNSIDAGVVPDYEIDDSVPDLKYHGFGASAEVTGPELYGDNPPLTGRGDLSLNKLQHEGASKLKNFTSDLAPYGKAALWSSMGIAGAGLAYLAYRFYGKNFPNGIFEYSKSQ